MGEDYAKFAGLTAEEDLKEPLKESIKKRLPWLLILLGLGMVVSSVVGVFEQVVSQLTIIMCFQSLILDMAGNVGTQSLAVTIRVLMDESLTGKQKLELVWKEMRIGFSNGVIFGSPFLPDHRSLHRAFQGQDLRFCLRGVRLYRPFPSAGHGHFRGGGNLHPSVFQEDSCGPGCSFRSPDHHHQRPGGSYFLLWSLRPPACGCPASGRITIYIGRFPADFVKMLS